MVQVRFLLLCAPFLFFIHAVNAEWRPFMYAHFLFSSLFYMYCKLNWRLFLCTIFLIVLYRKKAYNSGKLIRCRQGPPTKLTPDKESLMVKYIADCWVLKTPKHKDLFAEQIVHFMSCEGIKNTFPNTVPGDNSRPIRSTWNAWWNSQCNIMGFSTE